MKANMVVVRRKDFWIEVEIRTDILFASGIAKISAAAIPTLDALAKTLAPYPNAIRVEGHTDNKPIRSSIYPSNWELSSARAASVVHLLASGGVGPKRLSVIGLGEWHPAQSNDTVEGRNANRRVLLIILSGAAEDAPNGQPMVLPDANPQEPPPNGVTVAPVQPLAVPGEHAAPISTPLATATGSALPPVVTPATH